MAHLTKGEMERRLFPLPPLPEQQRIAAILGTWDRAIGQLEALTAAKETQLRGLMQRLLTGAVRLARFEGAWEEVKMGDIGQFYNGLSGKSKEDFGSGEPYLSYRQIFSNYSIRELDFSCVQVGSNEKQNLVQYGDVLMTTSSETREEAGMSSVYLGARKVLYLNSFCFGFRPNNSVLQAEFSQFYFRSSDFRRRISRLAQGSTRYNLSKKSVREIVLTVPPLEEQKEIATFLQSAKYELQLLNQKLAGLREQQRGLMARLLTGAVRV